MFKNTFPGMASDFFKTSKVVEVRHKGENSSKDIKIYVVVEVRYIDSSFGHQGFLYI